MPARIAQNRHRCLRAVFGNLRFVHDASHAPPDRAAPDRSHRSPALPNPVRRTFEAMAVVRSIGVAARTGVFSELANAPAEVADLATASASGPSRYG